MDSIQHLIQLKRGQLMLEARCDKHIEERLQRLKSMSFLERWHELEQQCLGYDNIKAYAQANPPKPAPIEAQTWSEIKDDKLRSEFNNLSK
jgi:hypothetical protein